MTIRHPGLSPSAGKSGGGGNRTRVTGNPETSDLQGKPGWGWPGAAWVEREKPRRKTNAELRQRPLKRQRLPNSALHASSEGWVYFVQAVDGGPVKIGSAVRSVAARLATLQACSPKRLRLLAAARGGRRLEFQLHEALAAHRLHGEWFDENAPDLAALIAAVDEARLGAADHHTADGTGAA